jgi:hypothetical protein
MATVTRKRVGDGKPLGKRWKKSLENTLMKDGAKIARSLLKAGEQTNSDKVLVKISATFFVAFPRRGKSIRAGDAGVQGVCTFPQKGVCKCEGQVDFPACCDLVVV